MTNTEHDFDKSDVFESNVLPLLKEASDICAEHGIPLLMMASMARVDEKFRIWSRSQGNPQRSPERLLAAVAVALPAFAAQLTNMAGEIAARVMSKVAKQETGHDDELAELLRSFSAVSRMGVTAHLIMRRNIEGLQNLSATPDFTNKDFGVDTISAIDKTIRTVFTAQGEAHDGEDTDGSDPDELVGVDDLPEQFRDLFRGLWGATD